MLALLWYLRGPKRFEWVEAEIEYLNRSEISFKAGEKDAPDDLSSVYTWFR
jgi:hypothetical protein